MRRKIWIIIAAVLVLILGVVIWQLDIPNWKKLDIEKLYQQPKSTVVYDQNNQAIGALASSENRIWKTIDEIPDQVKNAFIAAEDQQFYKHPGINFRRILAALWTDIKTMSFSQGASTITQQLIKLTHLTETKTISRKAQEIVLALQLERKLSKDQILECYLNTIYFGKGAYGIEAASIAYFGKDVSELTLGESALLAGVIKSPSGYAPHLNPEKSVQRRDLVLNEMLECGFITAQQAEAAGREKLMLAQSDEAPQQYGWYLDAVLNEASALLSLPTEEVLSSGYRIYTGFDPEVQDAADALFANAENFPGNAADGTPVQAALVVMNAQNGEISALVGGRSYEVRRGLNRATQIQRSPGSAIKPVSTYAAAIDAFGFSPTSLVEDTPREFDGGYAPSNAGGNTYGTVTMREALSRSLNIATVDLADLIGINAVRNYAMRFGLDVTGEDNNYALSLGSMTNGVSPAQLCGAYASLANGGTRVDEHLVRSVFNADGLQIYHADAPTQRAVKDSTAYMLTSMLKTAATTGSAHALAATGIPVAGKTGTVSDADGSTRDIWTAAYTPEMAVVAWMGYDTPNAQHQLPSSAGGSGYPAKLCAALVSAVSGELSKQDFKKPSDVRTVLIDGLALEEKKVLLATAATPKDYVVQELFHPDRIPQAYSTEWNAPEPVSDLVLLSHAGELPTLQFTSRSDHAEYLVLRTVDGETKALATLSGEAGTPLQYTDLEADTARPAEYSILPRHKLLYEQGLTVTGTESAAVAYSPGGLLNMLFGSDSAGAKPPEIEVSEAQSLFR